MNKLNTKDYYKVNTALKNIEHSIPIVFSIVEGIAKGSIYVDDLNEPKTVFLYAEDSFCYIAGEVGIKNFSTELRDLIFNKILVDGGELVLFPLSSGWNEELLKLFNEKGTITIQRKTFEFDKSKFEANKKIIELPKGYTLKQIDEEIAKKINITKSYKSVEKFVANGIGFCILKDGEVISACYSIHVGNSNAEIDIFTKEEYMGKGFARIVAASFIEKCIEKGLTPNWSCWPFRETSIILAKKLGFIEREDEIAHYWAPDM
ncbi:GNAT family N-acetyltransferase [Mycoplasmatota bacterium]|nr:GNAT family N-acetyltransferase [Mycoplasmatota bacterium]